MTVQQETGRRERNKADKRRRIEAAARRLFAEHGYSAVTTQEVARLADVGTGTLFRYAQSKGELLCMVANADFRGSLEHKTLTGDPVEDLLTLTQPLVAAVDRQPENAVAYHRESLFGEPGPHRAEALTILDGYLHAIAEVLAHSSGRADSDPEVLDAAQTVFDVVYMELVRSGVHALPAGRRADDLRRHLSRVLSGALPTLRAHA